jgi:large subunit ribosomal protein L25
MAGIVLTVEQRERTGTGGARASRKAGLIPGVLYGGSLGAVPIDLKATELTKALRSGKFISHLITLDHQGKKQPVIPKAIQYHPVSDAPIHVDLYRVEENTIIDVEVVVHFKNHEASPGLKAGGTLNIVSHTVALHVPAGKIPEEIVIDLAGKNIGDVFHIGDLNLPAGVQPTSKNKDLTIATIIMSRAGASDDAEAAAAAAAAAPAEEKK